MANAPSEDSDPPSLISQLDQGLRSPQVEDFGPYLPIKCTANTFDQTGHAPRLSC